MLHSKDIEDLIDRECGQSYTTPKERAAYRAGLSTAAAACDYVAAEYGSKTKLAREKSAAAKLCGDMLTGLRARISVPKRATAE